MRTGPKSTAGLGSPGALRPITPAKGGGFSLPAFMAAQSDGFWYDFSQTDRLFQENTGPTPASAPNDVIGLALSSRLWGGKTLAQYLASQPELVTNGQFTSGISGWTDASTSPATFTWDGALQAARLTRTDSNNARMDQSFPTVAGRAYRVSVGVGGTATSVSIAVGSTQGASSLLSVSLSAGAREAFFIADAATTWLRFFTNQIASATIDNVSIKEVTSYAATQATGTLKPKFQTTGAAFDGSDDNLLTGYTPGATDNFAIAKVTIPVSLSSTQTIAGSQTSVRFRLDVSTGGQISAALASTAVAAAGPDLRGTEAVVGFSCNGTSAAVFVNDAFVAEASQPSGGLPTTMPVALGAVNVNNARAQFFGGSIKSIIAGRQFLDLETFKKISAAL